MRTNNTWRDGKLAGRHMVKPTGTLKLHGGQWSLHGWHATRPQDRPSYLSDSFHQSIDGTGEMLTGLDFMGIPSRNEGAQSLGISNGVMAKSNQV